MISIEDIEERLESFRSEPVPDNASLNWMRDTLLRRMVRARDTHPLTGYQLDVWIILGQIIQLSDTRGIWDEEWKRRLTQITEREMSEDPNFIIAEKIWDVAQQPQLDYENLGSASKFLRKLSYEYEKKEDADQLKSLLTRAVVLGERFLQTNPPTRMVLWNIAKAHLQLWASRVYQDETLRQAAIRDDREVYGTPPTEKQLITHLTIGPYLMRVSGGRRLVKIQRDRLKKVHKYLKRVEDEFGSHIKSTSHLAKVKYLLGDSNREVEELLVKSVGLPSGYHNEKRDLVNARIMLGRFYEITDRPGEARIKYNAAKKLAERYKLPYPIARHRLSILRDR